MGRIVKINPNSVFASLSEYPGLEGMIHISEVVGGWVRDIRQYVKADQEIVALVISQEPLSLSLKRVNPKQRVSKMKEWGLEKRAEKMLELASKQVGKTADQAYEEAGFILQERFGTLFEAFKTSLTKPEKLEKLVSPAWADAIRDVAEKNIEQKEFEFRAKLHVRAPGPEGIEKVKEFLKKADKLKLDPHYIAAPNYLVRYRTKDPKKGLKEFHEKLDSLVAESGIEVSYTEEK